LEKEAIGLQEECLEVAKDQWRREIEIIPGEGRSLGEARVHSSTEHRKGSQNLFNIERSDCGVTEIIFYNDIGHSQYKHSM
jgi:hypothetical protein